MIKLLKGDLKPKETSIPKEKPKIDIMLDEPVQQEERKKEPMTTIKLPEFEELDKKLLNSMKPIESKNRMFDYDL